MWLSGLSRMFRAQFAENAGELGKMRSDVEAALACFRQVGDRWGQAAVLPLRAQLRQYNDDLDGALADLREARSLAGEFGSLSLDDEVFGDLDRARAPLDDAERGLRGGSAFPGDHVRTLAGSVRASLCVETGDLAGAEEALEKAYAAALETRDLPILSLVAVNAAALCEEVFAAAYGKGWELEGKTAVTEVDPARLCRGLGAAHPGSE